MFNIECIDFDENIYKSLLKTSTGKPIKARINVYPHYHDVISNINVTELKNDIDKMVSSYHLFDNFDKELLNLSTIIYSEINKEIISNIKKIFHYDAINENKKNKTRADIQSSNLGKMLLDLSQNKPIRILDYGAGLGRTYFEIKKETFSIITNL